MSTYILMVSVHRGPLSAQEKVRDVKVMAFVPAINCRRVLSIIFSDVLLTRIDISLPGRLY